MRPNRAAKLRSKGKTGSVDALAQETDPVQVFCRLRPKEVGAGEGVCCKAVDSTTVQYLPTQVLYKFTRVFTENDSQKCIFDNVAVPLVEDLVHGKHGLLFTYGITSSGKTHTMSGSIEEPGLLPRCLDMVFNSIGSRLARKYVFKPDGSNGFDIRSTADAMMERQRRDVMPPGESYRGSVPPTPRPREAPEFEDRVRDTSVVQDVDDDCSYAIFVSFIEVYNNSVYDLLEELIYDQITGTRPPSSKSLREDPRSGVMFVHGVTEVEVASPDEAFEILKKGQKRRKVAHTILNAESSRSHSVFTVRLVQAPLDASGQEVLQDKEKVVVTQLSLVDLAGSERTNRTKNSGDRLKEAGQINQSLMCLRNCIDILRENQKTNGNKVVPYRESKVTHLFKSYFDGEGKVRMIVCVNPKIADSDETAHVMKFAEATQEVRVARAQPQRVDVTFAAGRRQAAGIPAAEEDAYTIVQPTISGGLYSLGPPFPPTELHNAEDASILQPLQSYLENLHGQRRQLNADLTRKHEEFRWLLASASSDERQWQSRVDELQSTNDSLEKRLATAERDKERLQRQLAAAEARASQFSDQLARTERELAIAADERERIKADYRNKFSVAAYEHEKQLEREKQRLQMEANERVSLKDRKLRLLKNIVNTPSDAESLAGELASAPSATPRYASATLSSARAGRNEHDVRPTTSSAGVQTMAATPQAKPRQQPAAAASVTPGPLRSRARSPPPPVSAKPASYVLRNHRRSRSAGADRWLDHRPADTVETDTLLQPNIKKKRSVSKLDVRDTKDSTKYLLTHQEADAKGVLETKLIKGEVMPTAGGGSSVVFTDVETLKQTSPGDRKRRCAQPQPSDYDGEWTDTEDRCRIAVEGHGVLKRIRGDMP